MLEKSMLNDALASLLREMAFLGELKDENPFKIKAWQNSARILEEGAGPLDELIASGEIGNLPGFGKGSQAIAKEFVSTGRVQEHESLRAEFPRTIFELIEVPGLGPKKAKALYRELQIGGLSELEYACQENRLLELKGFGAKTQSGILANIQKMKTNRGKAILPAALNQAEDIQAELEGLHGVKRVEASGELRRLNEVISVLDFVVNEEAVDALKSAGYSPEGVAWIRTRPEELKVRAWPAKEGEFGSLLFRTTGPAAFVEAFGTTEPAVEESAVFKRKGRPYLPPECRELGLAPEGLIEEKDIRGVFHLHTDWSDGRNSLEEMVAAAEKLGWEYLGVSDHSQTAFYANGLRVERVLEQRKEVARVQAKFPNFKIFHGIESDILPDGSLDFPEEILAEFDFVIASVHGQMKMNRADMTARLVTVLKNPATTWLGHWTGRLLLGREGFEFDREAVLSAAAANGKGIELNANPYRLDMDWRLVPEAVSHRIPIGIFPDAHSAGGLEDLRYGVWMARKAGLTKSQVVNTLPRKEMEAWLQQRKKL